jgi:hypothetical protein
MPVRPQLLDRGTIRIDARTEPQCANCGWFMILHAMGSAGTFRGNCHRYDYLSAEKTPHVHADDWCFDHRPHHDLSPAIQEDRLLPRSGH